MNKLMAALEDIMVAATFAEHGIITPSRVEQEEAALAHASKATA